MCENVRGNSLFGQRFTADNYWLERGLQCRPPALPLAGGISCGGGDVKPRAFNPIAIRRAEANGERLRCCGLANLSTLCLHALDQFYMRI